MLSVSNMQSCTSNMHVIAQLFLLASEGSALFELGHVAPMDRYIPQVVVYGIPCSIQGVSSYVNMFISKLSSSW